MKRLMLATLIMPSLAARNYNALEAALIKAVLINTKAKKVLRFNTSAGELISSGFSLAPTPIDLIQRFTSIDHAGEPWIDINDLLIYQRSQMPAERLFMHDSGSKKDTAAQHKTDK
jgi:hypothetical protein